MMKRQFIQTLAAGLTLFTGLGAAGIAQAADKPRVAVVYFSKTGHTASVAEAVRRMTGADLYRVETVEPYPEAYGDATEVVKRELEENFIRPLKPFTFDPAAYDVVILASPTWWHHVAMPLQTWIRSVDLSGKTVLTCDTHGGGGTMETRADFESLLTTSRLGTHLTTFGAVTAMSPAVRGWLNENQVLN